MLKEGDIVSLDAGIIYKGYYSDTAVTKGIGQIRPELKQLLEVTYTSLYRGIEQARAGNHLSDISFAVQSFVEANKFSVVRDFVGHGIGKLLHEDPEIPNFGPPHRGPVLQEGMVLAIEPMVNVGVWQTRILDDGWTVVTQDGKPSAHFEHTIAITKKGPEILTE
jgi:methionyl aminopeptidase